MPEPQSRRLGMCLHCTVFDPEIALRQSGASRFVKVYEQRWYRDWHPGAERVMDHRRIWGREALMQSEATGDEALLMDVSLGGATRKEGG